MIDDDNGDVDAEYLGSFIRRLAEITMRSSDVFLEYYSAQDKNEEEH